MKWLRKAAGLLMLIIERLTRPALGNRSPESQQAIADMLEHHSVYQFSGCPFCVKVRQEMRRLNLPIELKDAANNEQARQELLTQGGKIQAPCLRIKDSQGQSQWVYESSEIIQYLNKTFPLQIA